jgi:hypothetical protein
MREAAVGDRWVSASPRNEIQNRNGLDDLRERDMVGQHPRLRRLQELNAIELRLFARRRHAMNTFLDATTGLDHDEPFPPDIEQLHTDFAKLSIEHAAALAEVEAELDAVAAELGTLLTLQTEEWLRNLAA